MPRSQTLTRWRQSRWFSLVWIVPAVLVILLLAVLAAQGLRSLRGVVDFVTTYPGSSELPDTAPVGFPAWVGWQHFLSAFLILLIIRTGWQVRTIQRPAAHWTRNNSGLIKTKNPPKRISIDLWLHLTLDVLWLANGVVFVVLLCVTGQWMRIVPTSWSIFPNALSAGIQYLSLRWPTEDGWVNYNALQVLSYFAVVFLASPLAAITGIRMSPVWPMRWKRVSAVYPVEIARAIHYPTMIFFTGFIVIHVALVFATGALRNLNHMYAGNDGESWTGFFIFAASLLVMVGAWVLARPVFLRPVASIMGKVSR